MQLENSADKAESHEVTIVVTVAEDAVGEIRAFDDRRCAEEVHERIETDEPWKDMELEIFRLLAHLEDMREDYLAWMRSQ